MTHPVAGSSRSARALLAYDLQRTRAAHPQQALLDALAGGAEQDWLECAQALVLRRDPAAALAVLHGAMAACPESSEIRLALAGALFQNGDEAAAESLLRSLLAADPGHAAAAFLLARMLKRQGRMQALATALRALFRHRRHDIELAIQAVELLDDCGRQADAAAICEDEIAAGCTDPRLHTHAGALLSQLGRFELARRRYEFALERTDQALEWHVPAGLAELQRYADESHPDFAKFRAYHRRTDLSGPARASLLFAMGKALDDIAEQAQAAHCLREANAIVHAAVRWPRKQWRRSVEARIGRRLPPGQLEATPGWTPVFIVGMPRSGTTLLAELLARHPQVCHRGELTWLPTLAEQISNGGGTYRERLEQARAAYAAQLRQDDSDARWFIDKQPHNFMHVDLILRLFPHARIIGCQRNARDNALSLWMQSFQAGTQEFAYDFADIGTVIQGSRRLMKHWQGRYPASIHAVRYEQLAADPATCLGDLSTWLELPAHDLLATRGGGGPIRTASLWQARQPIHTRSLQRWRAYAPHVPELLQLPDD
ncbi:MAG: sulfotransferase [Xanthomonadaceae bacterium]|nr:sulfotransferase [Xanthomonadaceae bacterium]